jgi:hypothetical protein
MTREGISPHQAVEKLHADQFLLVPLAKLTSPRSGRCIANHWWAVTDDGHALFYKWSRRSVSGSSPQCNTDKRIVEHIMQHHPFNVHAEFIPAAYMAHRDA